MFDGNQATYRLCPECGSQIPHAAKKCPECLSEIESKSGWPKIRGKAGSIAVAFRDLIGIPVAIAAVVTAFFNPAYLQILEWRGEDVPAVSASLYKVWPVNIGIDDVQPPQQVDKVTRYETLARGALTNTGYSMASLDLEFVCTDAEANAYRFVFVEGQPKVNTFVEDEVSPTRTPNTCTLVFYDKYGTQEEIEMKVSKEQLLLMSSFSPTDETPEWIEHYCSHIIRNFELDGVSADCMSNTHILAIEPIYLWHRAVKRAVRFSALYSRMIGSQATRRPGLILICNPEYSTCEENVAAMSAFLRDFEPAITAWICRHDDPRPMDTCREMDFSKASL
jgi:hypothetical protein